jgi:hypothetical protein
MSLDLGKPALSARRWVGRFPETRRRLTVARRVLQGHGVIFNVTVSGYGITLTQRSTPFDFHLNPGGRMISDRFCTINGERAALEWHGTPVYDTAEDIEYDDDYSDGAR